MLRGGARAHVHDDRTVVLDRPGALLGRSDVGLFALQEPPVLLVDGNNLLWRAAHGHPAPFTADDGRDVTPLFRFFSMLRRAAGSYGVFGECVVCFDGQDAWVHRLDIDPSYKSNRRYADLDLGFMSWLPEIVAVLRGAGVTTVEISDQEADDVIASFAASAGRRIVRILSTDRDYFQLLGATVAAVNSRCQPQLVDACTLRSRYGVEPGQWCDYRALAGDPSDGIPGVKGVGPRRAAELLDGGMTLGDLESSGRLDSTVGALVRAQWEDVRRWRELVRLRTDVAVGHALTGEPSPVLPSPTAVCRELGLITVPA